MYRTILAWSCDASNSSPDRLARSSVETPEPDSAASIYCKEAPLGRLSMTRGCVGRSPHLALVPERITDLNHTAARKLYPRPPFAIELFLPPRSPSGAILSDLERSACASDFLQGPTLTSTTPTLRPKPVRKHQESMAPALCALLCLLASFRTDNSVLAFCHTLAQELNSDAPTFDLLVVAVGVIQRVINR